MNLVVDVGNTNVVLGIFANDEMTHRWRINTHKKITQDEVVLSLSGLLGKLVKSEIKIENIALATVVPNIQYSWLKGLEIFFEIKPLIVQTKGWDFFNIDYSFPTQIGADRLCNVMGCQALNISDAIVVDFGTATTFDIYSDNTYWGGIICPGLQSSMMELVRQASKLSDVELYWNEKIIGKNTDDALRNGVLYGNLGQIDYIVSKILEQQPMNSPMVIATGGMANLIGGRTKTIQRVEKNMTMIGLNHFINRSMLQK